MRGLDMQTHVLEIMLKAYELAESGNAISVSSRF
jgi:hypothetical protein